MAINYVKGQILANTLERDGNNIAFTDTANTTPVLYIDIANSFVGVNTSAPNVALDIVGTVNLSNVGSQTANGNINITADGTGTVNISPNFTVTGNAGLTGNITLTATTGQLVTVTGTAGMVIPSGNTAQRPSPANIGTIRVNTALSQIEAWDGLDWISGGGSGNVTITDQQITPDGSTLTYTLDQDTDQASILVSFNGVAQLPGVAYTVTGNSITFSQAPLSSDIIDVRFLASTVASDRILNSTGNARVQVYDNSTILFNTNSANVASITAAGVFNLSTGHSLQLPVYTVAQAANLANVATGQVVYVSDGDTGNPCLAVYSGGAFKRISLGANIST